MKLIMISNSERIIRDIVEWRAATLMQMKFEGYIHAPCIFEIDGRITFPIFGASGGIASTLIFYIVSVTSEQKERRVASCVAIEIAYDRYPEMRPILDEALHDLLHKVDVSEVCMGGGDMGRAIRRRIY